MTITTSSQSEVHQPAEPGKSYERHNVPVIHIVTSLLGLGPIPFRWLITVLALVREQRRIGEHRPPGVPSHLELEVRKIGTQEAILLRDRGVLDINRLTCRIGHLQAQVSSLETAIRNQNNTILVGPYGQSLTLSDADELQKKLRTRLEAETENGNLEHRRASKGMRHMAWIVPPIDLPVLSYFLGELFNVNWLNPVDQPATFGAAIVFAILGTQVSPWDCELSAALCVLTRMTEVNSHYLKGTIEYCRCWSCWLLP